MKLNCCATRTLALNFERTWTTCCVASGAPQDRFLSNAFKCCLRLSGVLLKLCRLILRCAKKKTLISPVILGELEYSRIYSGIFVHLPKSLGLIAFSKMIADLFFDTQNNIYNRHLFSPISRKFEVTFR